jgi:hypothetical protein
MRITDDQVTEARGEIAAEVFREMAEYTDWARRNPEKCFRSKVPTLPMLITISKTGKVRAGRHCRLNVG